MFIFCFRESILQMSQEYIKILYMHEFVIDIIFNCISSNSIQPFHFEYVMS